MIMAKIDEIKEELNYLKLWLGMIVLTAIGLIGWLVNNYEVAGSIKLFASIVAILVLNVSIVSIDKKIKSKIKTLKDL